MMSFSEMAVPRPNHELYLKYNYRVVWDEEGQEYAGLCDEFPSLSHFDNTSIHAFTGIVDLVRGVVRDMAQEGETPPKPREYAYPGKVLKLDIPTKILTWRVCTARSCEGTIGYLGFHSLVSNERKQVRVDFKNLRLIENVTAYDGTIWITQDDLPEGMLADIRKQLLGI